MKERTLPESFWTPPDCADNVLFSSIMDNFPREEPRTDNIQITSPPDTHLLFSLFKIVDMQTELLNRDSKNGVCSKEKSGTDEDVNCDQSDIFETNDDPYLFNSSQSLTTRTENKSSYSDLLSDLVVKL